MVNTVPPPSVETVCRTSARARRSSSCRARRAPCAAVTPSARAVHRAYQDLGVLTGIEQRVLDRGGRADPRERGCGAAPGERGHALTARAAAPDVVAVPVVPDVALEPLVLDGALHAHVLEHAAHPGHQPVVGQGRELPVEGVLALGRGDHGPGDAGQSRGLAGVDLDDRAAGLLQGAPDAGLQAELEHRVEQQAAANPRPHPGGHLAGARQPPERRELIPLDEVGRDDPVAPEPVIAGGGDGLVDQRVERDRMRRRPRAAAARASVSVCERLSTKPARCAASCTLSVKTSAFFSRGSRASSPNIVDSVTDSRVAIALPRKRMPSFCWHDGQVSSLDSSSASRPDLGEHGQHPAVAVVRVVVGGRRLTAASAAGWTASAAPRRPSRRRPPVTPPRPPGRGRPRAARRAGHGSGPRGRRGCA